MRRAGGSPSWSAKLTHQDASGAEQMDQVAIERAIRSAVERERAAQQRKLEQGRTRFHQLAVALASSMQSSGKVKNYLRRPGGPERQTRHTPETASLFSVNHR